MTKEDEALLNDLRACVGELETEQRPCLRFLASRIRDALALIERLTEGT